MNSVYLIKWTASAYGKQRIWTKVVLTKQAALHSANRVASMYGGKKTITEYKRWRKVTS